jgi:hypothetical protein
MADYLSLDWDDQRFVGVAAHVASKTIEIRAILDFTWAEGEIPSEQPEAAGKRLRAELDRAGVPNGAVIVSLPREEAVVRLLELPECTEDELPELVRFQAVTRSALPLDRLLLDYLPLPTLRDAPGRRVWMATIGKPLADRVQTILSAAGLEAAAISLSSLGSAELIAHQPGSSFGAADPAALIVSCVDLRVEITAIWQHRIVLMHSATLSSHDPPEAQLSQILAETARSTVALSQAAPGLQIGSGWLIGSRSEESPLADTLTERFGFKFHVLTDPSATQGVSAEPSASLAKFPLAWAPLGLLLAQTAPRVDSIDFLHPRRQHPKPDRRKLYIALGVAAAVLVLLGIWGVIQRRVWQLEDQIAKMTDNNDKIKKMLAGSTPLRETASSVEDWTQRDIDWLEQFRIIEQAKGGADKLYLTTFDANVANSTANRSTLALIVAAGRAKVPNDVEDFEDQLHGLGYRVNPKEISEDTTDPQYPVKIDLNLDIVPAAAQAAEAKSGAVRPPIRLPAATPPTASPSTVTPPSSTTSTPAAAALVPRVTTEVAAPAAASPPPSGQASAETTNGQPVPAEGAGNPPGAPAPMSATPAAIPSDAGASSPFPQGPPTKN